MNREILGRRERQQHGDDRALGFGAADHEAAADASVIRLEDGPLTPGDLTLATLGRASHPLVFLNACESGGQAAGFGTSFVGWFLGREHQGVIATETLIPDVLAADFAASFYRFLLRGERAGQALLMAKRAMVREHGNPLGMVYTMYADPDLQVEVKVDEGVLA